MAVIGGVLAGTFLGILLVPMFYVLIALREPVSRLHPAAARRTTSPG
jgi:hypothetical protein